MYFRERTALFCGHSKFHMQKNFSKLEIIKYDGHLLSGHLFYGKAYFHVLITASLVCCYFLTFKTFVMYLKQSY